LSVKLLVGRTTEHKDESHMGTQVIGYMFQIARTIGDMGAWDDRKRRNSSTGKRGEKNRDQAPFTEEPVEIEAIPGERLEEKP
jgi:hypothetical protein